MSAPKNWDYGEEGRAWPVQVGEVWACGPHTFVCSDLMANALFDRMVSRVAPRLLYSDPPWGQGNANSFRTKAGLGKAVYRWTDLYSRIASIAHGAGVPAFVEGSKVESRDGAKVAPALEHPNYPATGYWPLVYYRRHPMGLYYAGREPYPPVLDAELPGVDDDYSPGIVMRAYANSGLVLDPCAGRGVTSRQAQENGWSALTNELNPNRVSAALDRMSTMIGEKPRRIS